MSLVKNKTFFWIFVPVLPILLGVLINNTCESSLCQQFESTYGKLITGHVINTYYTDYIGRRTGCIDILNKDKQKFTFRSFDHKEGYVNLQKGDSVYKLEQSAIFLFYRNGVEIVTINWDSVCEKTFKEFNKREFLKP